MGAVDFRVIYIQALREEYMAEMERALDGFYETPESESEFVHNFMIMRIVTKLIAERDTKISAYKKAKKLTNK